VAAVRALRACARCECPDGRPRRRARPGRRGFTSARAIYIGGLVAAWAVALLSILAIRGVPEVHHGAYFLDNHSDLTEVNRATYEHAQVLQQRIFTLIGATFFAAALIAHAPRPWGPRVA
jgi:hypothetical protein